MMKNWINKKPKGYKDIPGYVNRYAINREGSVYSYPKHRFKGSFLKETKTKKGYKKVSLMDEDCVQRSKFVHRLLMKTFCPLNGSDILCVNHLNARKDDNRLENLEWCTVKENNQHAIKMGLSVITQKMRDCGRNLGKTYGTVKAKPILQYSLNGEFIREFPSTAEAGRVLNLNPKLINKSLKKGFKSYSGNFRWLYKSNITKSIKGESLKSLSD